LGVHSSKWGGTIELMIYSVRLS